MTSKVDGQVVHTIAGRVRGPAYFESVETEADLVRAAALVDQLGWGLPGGAAMVAKAFAVERGRITAAMAAGWAVDEREVAALGDK